MYESFFECRWRPFASTPDARSYVPVGDHPLVLQQLKATLLDGQGIAILTAPAGLGKSLIVRRALYELRESFETVCLANANFPTRRSLLQAILYELGHSYSSMTEQELRLELMKAIETTCGHYQGMALAVDEAHRLRPRLLEELRTIAEQLYEGRSCVRLLLCGQLELEDQLAIPELEAVRQRVRCHTILQPLTLQESHEYLLARLHHAGADPAQTLTDEARMVICRASDDNPRCLNQLVDHSLLLGYMSEERPVTEETVRSALDDLRQLPLHWNEVPPLTVQLEDRPADSESLPIELPQSEQHVPVTVAPTGETTSPALADDSTAQPPTSHVVEFGAEDTTSPGEAHTDTVDADGLAERREFNETEPTTEPHSVWDQATPGELTGQEVTAELPTGADATGGEATGVMEFGFGLDDAEYVTAPSVLETSEQSVTSSESPQANDNSPVDHVPHDPADKEREARTMNEPKQDGFVEVPILDRYARLDSGREIPDDWPPSDADRPTEVPPSSAASGPSNSSSVSDEPTLVEPEAGADARISVEPPVDPPPGDPLPATDVSAGDQAEGDQAEGDQAERPTDDAAMAGSGLAFTDQQLDVSSRERAERSLEIIDRLGPMLDAALDGELPEVLPEEWATQLASDIERPGAAGQHAADTGAADRAISERGTAAHDSTHQAAEEQAIREQLAAMAAELGDALGDHSHPAQEIVENFRIQVAEEVQRELGQSPRPALDVVGPEQQAGASAVRNPRPVPNANGLFSRLRKQSDRSG